MKLLVASSLVVVIALVTAHASSRLSAPEKVASGPSMPCKVNRRGWCPATSTTTVSTTTPGLLAGRPSGSTVSRSAGNRRGASPLPVEAGPTALATWYSVASSSSHTASGETLDDGALTFAHRTMAFGTRVRFCRGERCVTSRCNDRGPFVARFAFDLSRATFEALAPLGAGVVTVSWETV